VIEYTSRVRKVKIHHVLADRDIFYAYCGNTAVELDRLAVSRARLTVVERALFEWDVFEMAALIRSPAKCEVHESCIASFPKCLKTKIHEAVTEKLGYRKLCARWVSKILTDDHKSKPMGSALKFLTRYARDGDEFLDYIVTGDETWGFHHTPESKQQSLHWRHTHSKGRRQTSMTRGYGSWFQDLINVWIMSATMLKNKVMHRQFIYSVASVN
jgi:hypothetical protein